MLYQKKITVGNANVTMPGPKHWKWTILGAKSQMSISLHFPQMLDHSSLQERLLITTRENNPIEGVVSIEDHETKWSFQPKEARKVGDYILSIRVWKNRQGTTQRDYLIIKLEV